MTSFDRASPEPSKILPATAVDDSGSRPRRRKTSGASTGGLEFIDGEDRRAGVSNMYEEWIPSEHVEIPVGKLQGARDRVAQRLTGQHKTK